MPLEPDIIDRIRRDFSAADAETVIELVSSTGHSGRVARCVVFAARGDVDRLLQIVHTATMDYRDAIMAGEYEGNVRVRSLDVPFPD